MYHILREIKLSKLTDTPMSDDTSKLVEFWGELWIGMKVSVDPTKGEIKCWKEDYDHYYFLQVDKNDYLWCDYYGLWSLFRKNFSLNYGEIQEFIQYMVGVSLNYGVNTPIKTSVGLFK